MIHTVRERQVGRAMPAARAVLRRICGVHSHISPVGPCCLTRDEVCELAPRGVVDTLGQAPVLDLLDHVPDTQVLDRNEIELVDDTATLLVSEVLALPSRPFVRASNHLTPLPAC